MSAVTSPYAQLNALIDTVLDDRYRIEAMIGTGGMGAIYRARREGLERPVALKVLHPAVSSDPTTAKRFEREAYSVSKLDHPNIVRVSDYGTTKDGMTYFAMELVEGTQLTSHLGEPMPPARAADLIAQVLEGLDHAHSRKIVHRDLKPDNVLVHEDARGAERVKLVDFGIAKVLEDRKTQERLTQTGFVYGTPHYMSPEQATGGTVDHRADLYAVGLILYEMLAGHRAFRALDPASMLRKQVTQPHDPLPADVPRRLAHIVDRLLEKAPEARFQTAREVLDALAATRSRLEGVPAAKLSAGGDSDLATRADPAASTVGARHSHAGSRPTAASSLSSSASRSAAARPEANPPSLVPWAIAGLAVAGLGGAVGYMLMENDPAPAVAAAADDEPEQATAGETGAVEIDDGKVSILINANVEAKIIDASDGGVFGTTGQAFEVEKSEGLLQLILRADGHDDRPLQIKPNADKVFEQVLRESRPHNPVIDLRDPWNRGEAPAEQDGTETDPGRGSGDAKALRPPDSGPDASSGAPAPTAAPGQSKDDAAKRRRAPGRKKKATAKEANSPELTDPFERGQAQ